MITNENKWGVVYCPNHEVFWPKKTREKVEKSLKAHAVDYDFVQSEKKGSVARLVKMFINNGYTTIVIVGGDSSLNDAANALMQVEKAVRDRIALGIIPNGTMNDFAHYWEFKEDDYDRTIEWLKSRRIRKIDLGYIHYQNAQGDTCRRYFLNCVNIGLVAAITNLRKRTHHFFLGSRALSFIFSFVLMGFQRLEYKMNMRINSETIKRKVMTVCIGNCQGYGQTPNAVPYNGLLDVSVVCHPQTRQFVFGIYLFLKGKILNHRSVLPYRTRRIEVLNSGHAPVSIDGRLMRTPVGSFSVGVEQEVINFIIPS